MSSKENRRIFCVKELCIGCGACAKVCTLIHSGTTCLHFESIPHFCAQCKVPPCADVCSSGAFFVAQNGLLSINPLSCVGCRRCAIVCPFSAIAQTHYFIAAKCDLCATLPENARHEREHACVAVCPTGALIFIDPLFVAESPKFGATLFRCPKSAQPAD